MTAALRVARISERCTVLGPGTRSVVWVQGCELRCRECIAPEALALDGGVVLDVAALAERLSHACQDGLTLSGGEPFLQAAGLCDLVDRLRAGRPEGLSVMAFSGFTREQLAEGAAEQRALLERLDLLVDGPYLPERHARLRWRGSDNQRLHVLSGRHADRRDDAGGPAGMEAEVAADGRLRWAGVPPVRGFRSRLGHALAERATVTAVAEPPLQEFGLDEESTS